MERKYANQVKDLYLVQDYTIENAEKEAEKREEIAFLELEKQIILKKQELREAKETADKRIMANPFEPLRVIELQEKCNLLSRDITLLIQLKTQLFTGYAQQESGL